MKAKINIPSNIDTNFLKIIAFIAMILDHVGKILYPDIIILQIIGRIAFPIFAYCISIGFIYTSNVKKYALRLFVLGIVSQPFFMLAFNYPWYILNIFFTLLLGLIFIYLIDKKKWTYLLFLAILSIIFNFYISYGIFGILLIILFYLYINDRAKSFIMSIIILLVVLPGIYTSSISIFDIKIPIQAFAIFSLPLIYIKTSLKIKLYKYTFYLLYPLHLLILYLIKNNYF